MNTINSIPPTYGGKIKVVINDNNPVVVARNFLLLLTLNGAGDSKINADIALHFWYSTFLPIEYKNRLLWLSEQPLKDNKSGHIDIVMDAGSRICGNIGKLAAYEWARYINVDNTYNPYKFAAEFKDVM